MIIKCLKKVGNSTISSLFSGIVVIMAMFLIVACEKNETSVADQQQTVRKPQPISDMEVMQYLPDVVDGRLVFKDKISFEKYQQWVFENQGSSDKMHNINKSLGFVSMREIYDEGLALLESGDDVTNDFIKAHKNVFHATEVDGSIIQDLQAPSVVSYFANKNGIYQVGERIIRSSYDYCYIIVDADISCIPMIINASNGEVSLQNIEITPTRDYAKDQIHYHTDYFSNTNKRIVARINRSKHDGYHYWEAETNSQQKIGVWLGKQLSGVWLTWDEGYYGYNGNNIMCSSGDYGGASYQTIKHDFCIMPESYYPNNALLDLYSSLMETEHIGMDGSDVASFLYTNSFLGYW